MEYLKIKAIKAVEKGMCSCVCHSEPSTRHIMACCSFSYVQRNQIFDYVSSKSNAELMEIIATESKLNGLR